MTFIDRRVELAQLKDFLRRPPQAARHRAIISFRRMGKTRLIGEFRRLNPKTPLAYVDVEATDGRPEKLALRFAATLVAEVAQQRHRADAASLQDVLILGGGHLQPALLDRVRTYVESAPRRALVDVLRDGLLLADDVLAVARKNALLFFDECQEWFAAPDENPTAFERLFREIGDRSKTRYVFAGSARRVMDATFREAPEEPGRQRRPLHGRVAIMPLGAFDRADTRSLVSALWARLRPPVEAIERVYALTRGHPAAATHLAERTATDARLAGTKIDVATVSNAFAREVFERGGYLNAVAEADYNAATAQPRGGDSFKKVVDAIADLDSEATQARIAARSGVAQPNVAKALPRLLDLDFLLFDEGGKTYTFANPIVGVWLRGRSLWSPGATTPVPPRIAKLLEEQVKRLSDEAGTTFEARVRDTANRFNGQRLPGRLFGQSTEVTVPAVRKPSVPIEDVDRRGLIFPEGTSVQLDLFIDDGDVWLGEVRHRRHAVSAKDVRTFWDKTEFFRHTRKLSVAQRWFVSNAGFEEKAIQIAKTHGILLTTARQFEQIARVVTST